MRAATEGSLPPVMPQGNLIEVLGREVRQGSPGELMVESTPSRRRRPPCKTNKEESDEAADAAALTYLLTYFAFVAHNMKEHGQDRSRWNRLDPRTKNRKEPRRIGNPPLSFPEYRSQHDGCWVCYGKGNNHAHDHRHCKVYEEDKKTYFAAHPDKKPKEQRIADWKAKGGDGGKGQGKGQGKDGGKGYGGGPGPDRHVRSIEEVAEDLLRTLEELKGQQRGGQSLSGSQQEGAAAGHV